MGNCVGGKGKKDPTILTEEEIKLLLENTKLNRAQINALHQNFLKECPSGKLTKKDFVKLFKEVHPSENKKEKADKFCEYVFKVIDRDSLGYISFNDFVLCFSLTSYGDFKQKCEFAFRLYDLDKDNKISKKEMTQVLVALYDLSGITDRKKDKAPAKKVDEIMRLINHQTEVKEKAAAEAAGETVAAEAEGKKGKKAKKPKAKDFITREQFIEACSEDEALKKLFVDSIFAATAADVNEAVSASVSSAAAADVSLKIEAPSVSGAKIDLGCVDQPEVAAFEVTTTTTTQVETVELEAPSMEMKLEAPVVDVKAEAPAVEVNDFAGIDLTILDKALSSAVAVEAPVVEVSAEAPVVEVKAEAPAVEVNDFAGIDLSILDKALSSTVVVTETTEEKSDEKTAEV